MKLGGFKDWKWTELDRFSNLGRGKSMYSKEVILGKTGDIGRLDLHYRQIRAFLSEPLKRSNVFCHKTSFEILLVTGRKSKFPSRLYNIIVTTVEIGGKAKSQWEKGLSIIWTDEELYRLKQINYTCSRNNSDLGKSIYWWNLVPNRLAKMFPQCDGNCWWCRSENTDFQYKWWNCASLKGVLESGTQYNAVHSNLESNGIRWLWRLFSRLLEDIVN